MKMCQIWRTRDSESAGLKPKKDFVVSPVMGGGGGVWDQAVAGLASNVHLISVLM